MNEENPPVFSAAVSLDLKLNTKVKSGKVTKILQYKNAVDDYDLTA